MIYVLCFYDDLSQKSCSYNLSFNAQPLRSNSRRPKGRSRPFNFFVVATKQFFQIKFFLQDTFFRFVFCCRTLFSNYIFATDNCFQIIFLLQITFSGYIFATEHFVRIIFLLQKTFFKLYSCYRTLCQDYIFATEDFFSNYIFATDHFLKIIFLLQNTFLRLYFSSEHFFRLYFCFRLPLSFLLLGLF